MTLLQYIVHYSLLLNTYYIPSNKNTLCQCEFFLLNTSDQLLTGDEAFSLKITPLFSLGGEWAREDVEEAGTLLYSKGDEDSGEVEVVDGDPS